MNITQAFLLGAVQGLTEFLPVSSSGHLVLFQSLLKIQKPMLAFDIAVHWGTLFAVFLYFKKDLANIVRDCLALIKGLSRGRNPRRLLSEYPGAGTAGFVIAASVPTALIAFIFRPVFESLFHSLFAVAIAWMVMAVLLFVASRYGRGIKGLEQITVRDALILGVMQGLAIIPGISRSGVTISAAMLAGIRKETAATFSFLMAIPAILGAGAFEFKEGMALLQSYGPEFLVGFATALGVGYVAIAFLIKILKKDRFHHFGYYCGALSLLTFFYLGSLS